MTGPIRPPLPGEIPQTAPARPDAGARAAAQKAFFQAALGGASAQAQPEPVKPVQPTVPARTTGRSDPGEPPQKILRPGSLLDIRV